MQRNVSGSKPRLKRKHHTVFAPKFTLSILANSYRLGRRETILRTSHKPVKTHLHLKHIFLPYKKQLAAQILPLLLINRPSLHFFQPLD